MSYLLLTSIKPGKRETYGALFDRGVISQDITQSPFAPLLNVAPNPAAMISPFSLSTTKSKCAVGIHTILLIADKERKHVTYDPSVEFVGSIKLCKPPTLFEDNQSGRMCETKLQRCSCLLFTMVSSANSHPFSVKRLCASSISSLNDLP